MGGPAELIESAVKIFPKRTESFASHFFEFEFSQSNVGMTSKLFLRKITFAGGFMLLHLFSLGDIDFNTVNIHHTVEICIS